MVIEIAHEWWIMFILELAQILRHDKLYVMHSEWERKSTNVGIKQCNISIIFDSIKRGRFVFMHLFIHFVFLLQSLTKLVETKSKKSLLCNAVNWLILMHWNIFPLLGLQGWSLPQRMIPFPNPCLNVGRPSVRETKFSATALYQRAGL